MNIFEMFGFKKNSNSDSFGERLGRLKENDKGEPLGIGAFTQQRNISPEDLKAKELLPLTPAEREELNGLRSRRDAIMVYRHDPDRGARVDDNTILDEITPRIQELEAREKVS